MYMGVVVLRNRIMKRKARPLPVWTAFLPAFALLIAAFSFSPLDYLPENLFRVSYLLAMPDGAAQEISEKKEELLSRLRQEGTDLIMQKSGGSVDEEKKQTSSGSLTKTPSDIAESMKKIQKLFDDGTYVCDGEVVEKTLVDYQATDSSGDVYVRNVTADTTIDVGAILESGCSLPVSDPASPTVLIYHTHTTESYIVNDDGKFSTDYPTKNDDTAVNMVRIGDEIARILEENGIGVLHDRTIYDTTYTGAYDKSREGVLEVLERYPSVKITLDIHRDAVYYDDYTRLKPVAEIDGVKAAQMMIITGAEGGSVESFPSWETNLSFALALQKTANEKYPKLMKPIYFCNRKYNMDLTPYSLLIEVGTDVNTLAEAAYSGRLLGDVLSDFIKENAKGAEK